MKIWMICLGMTAAVGSSAFNFATAAVARSAHEALTLDIQNSIEWSQHVITEVNKGVRLNVNHANSEIVHLKGWLEKTSKTYAELSKQPLSETNEAHFLAVKTHQEKAEGLVSALSIQINGSNRNIKEIKKTAKNIRIELEAAADAHKAELLEIERL